MLDYRKAARHCRETMEAYRRLAEQDGLGLCDLDNEAKRVYSTHRRVFDSNTDTLMLAADMPVSARAASRAAISAKRSRNSDIRDMLVKRNSLDTEAMLKRRNRLERTPEEVAADNAGSEARKMKMKERNTDGGPQ